MASIRQRSGTRQARVRRKGDPDEVAPFKTNTEAQAWARSIESAMDQGVYQNTQSAKDILLPDVLQRYKMGVTPPKRGAQREAEGIQFMMRQKIASYSMTNLTPAVIAGYRDDRLKTVSVGTIIRELSILSGIISHARKEWSLPTTNPCALVRKSPTPSGRTRLLTRDEEARLLDELKPVRRRSPWMVPLATLALESAMRRGKLLSLRWENINFAAQPIPFPHKERHSTNRSAL